MGRAAVAHSCIQTLLSRISVRLWRERSVDAISGESRLSMKFHAQFPPRVFLWLVFLASVKWAIELPSRTFPFSARSHLNGSLV